MIELTTTTKWYRPGLQFTSPYAAYEVICRPYHRTLTATGEVLAETRELKAEFAVHGGEYTYTNADGMQDRAADIRGHFFDLDAQAEQKGWTAEEKETVARKLLMETTVKYPGECQLYSAPPVDAPWPKYDELTNYKQAATLADQLGLVAEALAYEKQNKNRQGFVAEFEAKLAEQQPTQQEGDSSDELSDSSDELIAA